MCGQRSLDGKTWTDVGTDVPTPKRNASPPWSTTAASSARARAKLKGEPITVIFKRRYPAMVNPQLRQRVDQHW